MRQSWLDELPNSSPRREDASHDEAANLYRQAHDDQRQHHADWEPSIWKLAAENADDGCEHAHSERPLLQPARLRIDAVIDQSLHTPVSQWKVSSSRGLVCAGESNTVPVCMSIAPPVPPAIVSVTES